MSVKNLEYDIKRFNSLILRITLVFVLSAIFFININTFPNWLYYFSITLYILLLLLNILTFKNLDKGIIRLFLDCIIICLFLYKKDLDTVFNYFPFILLLFNTQSHSSKNGKFWLFIVLIHLSIIIIDNFIFKLTHHIIPVLLYIFIFIIYIRNFISLFKEDMLNLVGNLFIENVNENNSHRILKNIIQKINSSKIGTFNKISEIFLFINNNEKFVLIKGSKFVTDNELKSTIHIENIIINNHEKSNFFKDSVEIDGISYKISYWLHHKILEKDYYFLIALKKDSIFNEFLITSFRPIFEYVGRIYYMSNSLMTISNENQKIIKQKIAYVFDAQNALHYVKNKLTPITSTINLMDRYFRQKDLSPENKVYIENRLLTNNNNYEIKQIIKKAEILIKGVDNILEEKDKCISLKALIDDIRKNWFFHFNNIDDVIISVDNLKNIKIEINQMMFDFVFTDIIENINKYGKEGGKRVEISLENDIISILFSNKISDYDRDKRELDEIVNLYNLTNNDEIYSRKTHGLSFIRRLLRRKNIENKIFINKEAKTFNNEIKLKRYIDENTSI